VRLQPHVLAAIGATLDVFVAGMLYVVGIGVMAAFMLVVAVIGYVLAIVLWRRASS
jgi:uncharacterized membrane protein YeaQ/YmgE (transglycosylase-associated protein family)